MLQMRFVVPLLRRAHNPGPQSSDEGTESLEVDVSDPVHPIFSFHTCTSDVHIIDTPWLHELLAHPLPDDDTTTTPFDLAVHLQIIKFEDDGHGHGFNLL
ncbi:hypothetical protein K443DRAFT_1986 [Laccaria amethystina LaAM-08-1]|uniref:Uncharacterized protein n=1 Tax=Laccaria amethystina LaAM-08-1 TaxID=1095629 RepID=A0A0C9XRT0_9AGAR|nr:hypothetical protein K443DRAFT_1986 [Laccaria amethystina LaAM-08-1]